MLARRCGFARAHSTNAEGATRLLVRTRDDQTMASLFTYRKPFDREAYGAIINVTPLLRTAQDVDAVKRARVYTPARWLAPPLLSFAEARIVDVAGVWREAQTHITVRLNMRDANGRHMMRLNEWTAELSKWTGLALASPLTYNGDGGHATYTMALSVDPSDVAIRDAVRVGEWVSIDFYTHSLYDYGGDAWTQLMRCVAIRPLHQSA